MTTSGHGLLSEYLDRFGALAPDPLCPEIRAWNTLDYQGLWRLAVERGGKAAVPYWAIVWPGGRGLARFILDNKRLFKGRRVVDVGTGSGITAVAAAMAGARVTAIDLDPAAIELASISAESNGMRCEFRATGVEDISGEVPGDFDVIIAGDIFNSREFAEGAIALARKALKAGVANYLSDSGRSHRPRSGFAIARKMTVPVFREIEGVTERDVTIMSLVE